MPWQGVACDKPCTLAGRSLLLPEEVDRTDSTVPCPPRRFFCLLLLLLHHGLEGFLEQGVFRSRAHWQASLMKVAAQNALVETSMGGGVQLVAIIEQVVFIGF